MGAKTQDCVARKTMGTVFRVLQLAFCTLILWWVTAGDGIYTTREMSCVFVFGAFFWMINIAILVAVISVVANIYEQMLNQINPNGS